MRSLLSCLAVFRTFIRLLAFGLALMPATAFAAAPANAPAPPAAAAQVGSAPIRYFPETGHSLTGNFKDFFEAHGGLDAFGFPRTEAVMENGFLVQYFQRGRLEWHPELNQVQISLLGSLLTQGRTFATVPATPNSPDLRFYPQTG